MYIARKFFIRGTVQGVGFRFFTQRSAARHQVTGYVRNLPDGRVEAFKHDLAAGPRYAKIDELEEIVSEPDRKYSTFRIER
jgi:acylphosphatase